MGDLHAQIKNPVSWKSRIESTSEADVYRLVFDATIEDGWKMYSSNETWDDGPLPTEIVVELGDGQSLVGEVQEVGKFKKVMDPFFDAEITSVRNKATFSQAVKVDNVEDAIKGYISFMSCDATQCTPPIDADFVFFPKLADKPSDTSEDDTSVEDDQVVASGGVQSANPPSTKLDGWEAHPDFPHATYDGDKTLDQRIEVMAATYKDPLADCGEEQLGGKKNLLLTFLGGFLGGLAALLTPCVFPMIPLTVSFFTKGSTDRKSGIRNGLIFGASIIAIYLAIGLIITGLFGAAALQALSTNWIANTLFFLLFVVFAFSFFGYFEITLPSSWTTKTDSMANKGGLVGTFFMAFTLALVSFSCTGPIIGTALVQSATSTVGPAVVMLGFSTALALPFGLFAAFPGWLNSLPKSGGWMNSVKVVLGFLELGLALKFLSVADLTMHWGILKYELFLGIWVLLALLTTLYLLGLIKFPHDSPVTKRSATRWVFTALFAAATVYLAMGFRVNKDTGNYATPKALSGILPPAHYNLFLPPGKVNAKIKKRYPSYGKCANNINCFKDYSEGLAYARETGKPLFIDFTGHGCVNCRKVEDKIWVEGPVWQKLNQDFVLVSLYTDDREKLKKSLISKNTGEKIRNIGRLWAEFQIENFEQNSQPLYVILNTDEEVIATPIGYNPDERWEDYNQYMVCGLENALSSMK